MLNHHDYDRRFGWRMSVNAIMSLLLLKFLLRIELELAGVWGGDWSGKGWLALYVIIIIFIDNDYVDVLYWTRIVSGRII